MAIKLDEFGKPYRSIEILDDDTDGNQIRDNSISTNKLDSNFVSKVEIVAQAGAISLWATTTAPTGYLFCNGQAVSRTLYPNLFAVWGTTFGVGDGSTTFNVANFNGRTPVGVDGGAEFTTVGSTYGSKTHTLTTGEMPSHDHNLTDPGHDHTTNAYVANASNMPNGDGTNGFTNVALAGGGSATASSNTTGITIDSEGGGGAHNNIQPSIAVYFIVKY